MKLIGNSVSVPVIDNLCQAIIKTGVFEKINNNTFTNKHSIIQLRQEPTPSLLQ